MVENEFRKNVFLKKWGSNLCLISNFFKSFEWVPHSTSWALYFLVHRFNFYYFQLPCFFQIPFKFWFLLFLSFNFRFVPFWSKSYSKTVLVLKIYEIRKLNFQVFHSSSWTSCQSCDSILLSQLSSKHLHFAWVNLKLEFLPKNAKYTQQWVKVHLSSYINW